MKTKGIKIKHKNEKKYSTLTGANLLKNNSNPPPKLKNILKLNQYIKLRKNHKENQNEEDHFCNFLNNNIETHQNNGKYGTYKERNSDKKNDIFRNKNQRNINKNKTASSSLEGTQKSLSSKDNLAKFKNNLFKEKLKKGNLEIENREELITKRDEEEHFSKRKIKRTKKNKK